MSGPFGAGALQYFGGDAGFYPHTINQSLRFEDGGSAYLYKTYGSSAGGNTSTWTFSVWLKIGDPNAQKVIWAGSAAGSGYTTNLFYIQLRGDAQSNRLDITWRQNSGTTRAMSTNRAFRDPSAWMHIILACDTTQSTDAYKLRLYINGTEETSFSSDDRSTIGDDTELPINANSYDHAIGRSSYSDSAYFDGYMAEIHFVDGTQLTPTSFGETKAGIWIPKNYTGSHGTTGFYLPFDDSSALGDDESANTNDWTPSGFVASDVVPDSPTNNWCTINPVASLGTQSEGNLKNVTTSSGYGSAVGSMGHTSGKWYWEVIPVSNVTGAPFIGVVDETYDSLNSGSAVGYLLSGGKDSIGYYNNGALVVNTDQGDNSYGASYTGDDIIGVALNLDDNEITFYKNNSTQGAFSHTFSGNHILPAVSDGTNSASQTFAFNFGQDSSFADTKTSGSAEASDGNGVGDFYYTPPSGFLALCSANFSNPNIDPAQDEQSTDFFNTVTYTGNGTSASDTQAISGVGFSPDFTWIKNRTDAGSHVLNDRVRGAGKNLFTNAEAEENSGASTGDLFTSFDSDGFTVNYQYAGTTNNGTNQNSKAYVAWNWLAGGSATSYSVGSDDSTNPQVASEVSANTKAGFSIVTFTAPAASPSTVFNQGTVKHGLTKTPEIFLYKARGATSNWFLRTNVIDGSQDGFQLAGSLGLSKFDVSSTYGSATNKYIPTYGFNTGTTMLVYCFHNVEGHSRVGIYTGNGESSDGTFVYTGFRPAFVVTKAVTTTASYYLHDAVRDPINQTKRSLYPNLSSGEDENYLNLDLLSNGFKLRTNTSSNASGTKYFYFAFAEQPFKYSNAR